jgi:RHS repeat-associated protein
VDHFPAYDGSGNVQALVSATNGSSTAVYEYDPFGAVLRETGIAAKQNPMRFSTQWRDDVSGSAKYLHRELRSEFGRWTSRDPVGEQGCQNLYVFVENNPITKVDQLGLSDSDITTITEQFKQTMKRMCDKEQRCDCFGVGPLKDIKASFGKPWGCAAQADSMEGDVISLLSSLQDGWKTEHRRYPILWPIFWHQDVKVTPTDAKSGNVTSVILDTFKGCYTINKREPFIIPPFTVYWVDTHSTRCFTCEDFRN